MANSAEMVDFPAQVEDISASDKVAALSLSCKCVAIVSFPQVFSDICMGNKNA